MATDQLTVKRAILKPHINDVRNMTKAKLERELEYVTSQIEDLQPWQEALTVALEWGISEETPKGNGVYDG